MATVKVRIAVVISADGDWYATGWNNDGDTQGIIDHDTMCDALDVMSRGLAPFSQYFVEATLEIPTVKTVLATRAALKSAVTPVIHGD